MGTHPIFESDFDCLTDYALKKIMVGAGVWILVFFWIAALVIFIVGIRSNQPIIGILVGVAALSLTTIFAVIPIAKGDENKETLDPGDFVLPTEKNFPLKIAYAVSVPLIAMVTWGYFGISNVYAVTRPKRLNSVW